MTTPVVNRPGLCLECILILSTARFALRPLREGDEAGLYALYGNAEFMRFAGREPWADASAASAFIERVQDGVARMTSVRLGVFDGDQLVGTCGLLSIDKTHGRAELGYGVSVGHWGHGIAREAAHAILDWGFGELELRRVAASVDPDNMASIRVLKALGFCHEGTLREHLHSGGRAFDSRVYGLLAHEWRREPHDAGAAGQTGKFPPFHSADT